MPLIFSYHQSTLQNFLQPLCSLLMLDAHIHPPRESEPAINPGRGEQEGVVMTEAGVEQNATDTFQQVTSATDKVEDSTPAHNGDLNQNSLTEQPKLSKNALKRIRRQEAWLEKKKDRRFREKQKKKEARVRKREEALKAQAETHIPEMKDVVHNGPRTPPPLAGIVDRHSAIAGQKRKAGENGLVAEEVDGQSKRAMAEKQKTNPIKVPIGVIIDCGFDDCMTKKVPRHILSLLARTVQLNNWSRRLFLFRPKSPGATPRTGNLRYKFNSL